MRGALAQPVELVLTAARPAQARGYEAQLAARERLGDLPSGVRWRVVTDPGGRRAGSGAATALGMLATARELAGGTFAERFGGRRTLIIHSGGDSKRLPAFAAVGKAFAPLPVRRPSGAPATIFDLILADLAAMSAPAAGQVLVASGDAVVGAGRESIDLDTAGVVGIAQRGSVERGSRHGVYVADRDGLVRDFLQKPSAAEAKSKGAIRSDGTLLVDTGLVSFDPRAAEAVLHGFGVELAADGSIVVDGLLGAIERGETGNVDLYHHLLLALVPTVSEADFLASLKAEAGTVLGDGLLALRRALSGTGFTVRLSRGEGFLHAGTTREYLETVLRDRDTAKRFGLSIGNGLRAVGSAACAASLRRGASAVVEGCLEATLALGGENLVVGLPKGAKATLPRGVGCVALPISRAQWATILFHVDDDPKRLLAEGGTIVGQPAAKWCAERGLELRDLAGDTLWDARLWRIGKRPEIDACMFSPKPPPRGWRSARRASLAELLNDVSHERMVALEAAIAARRRVDAPLAALLGDDHASAQSLATGVAPREWKRLARTLRGESRRAGPLERARALAVAARIEGRDDLPWDAFDAVSEAVSTDVHCPTRCPKPGVRFDEAAWASAPARIDLAGGWSDTPPICNERGGSVVNLAIALDGRLPVQVVAKRLEEPVIAIHSVDLGLTAVFRSARELHRHRDPRDWTALAKAALRLAGLVPPTPKGRLESWLKPFGGGLSLATFAAVPKGSGLGTSSILGAAALACLDRATGRTSTRDELIERTSALEQLIATRGGWQDQVGGMLPGFKIARTVAGPRQIPSVELLAAQGRFVAQLEARAVFCFTGLRRMARDILQRVVERYLVRDGDVLATIARLREGAERMREAIAAGDLDRFAAAHRDYWSLKTTIDPNATTPAIERFVAPFAKHLDAWSLPGAGGGGFLFLLAKSEADAERIRGSIERAPPHPLARIVPWAVAREGLRVSNA